MKKVLSIFIILGLLAASTFNPYAKPGNMSDSKTMIKDYLYIKMDCLTTRNLENLNKYYQEGNTDAQRYLLFTKMQLLQNYLVAYSNNNYSIKKVFPKVRITRIETKGNISTVNALVTAYIHWNAQNSYGDLIVGVAIEKHTIEVKQDNNNWTIISDKFQTDLGSSELCINMPYNKLDRSVAELNKTANAALTRAKSSPPTELKLLPHRQTRDQARDSFNRNKAYAWAHKYWKNYSNKYVNLGDQEWEGGDCTNFVSQCLRAGGAQNDNAGSYKWYYSGKVSSSSKNDSYSWTWSTAKGLNSILMGNFKKAEFGPKGTEKIISGDSKYTGELGEFISVGDLIQYEWSASSGIKHSAIIVGMVNNSTLQRNEPVISTHSFDSWNLPWTKNAYRTHFVHITGVN